MTCQPIPSGVMCTATETHALKVLGRTVYVELHFWGPAFFTDKACTRHYLAASPRDPVWPVFNEWNERRQALQKGTA